MVDRLLAGRARHRERHKVLRVAWAVLGFLVIIAGALIAPLPGPGPLIIIPLGLAMLALEFVWAERLLERALVYGERARSQASGLSTAHKVIVGIAVVLLAFAVVTVVVYYEIPYLPG